MVYLVLLTPTCPSPNGRSGGEPRCWHVRRWDYYCRRQSVLHLGHAARSRPGIQRSGFGHTSKRCGCCAGRIDPGDQGWSAEAAGRRLFERVYLPEDGSWAQAVLRGGQTDKNKNWWIFAELDQFSGTLALGDLTAGRYLPQTAAYWFKYFVDTQYGEVWNGVNYGLNSPQRDYPKAWAWKSAYHSFEHALVGYITAQYLHGEPAKLTTRSSARWTGRSFTLTTFRQNQSLDEVRDSTGNCRRRFLFQARCPPSRQR
jgi:hypothetical protein